MWQPISSVPKDGTRVLLYFKRHGVLTACWDPPDGQEGCPLWVVDDFKHGPYYIRGYAEDDVTHWMPLPDPPL